MSRQGYLFGYPLAHSLSPLLHRTVFREEGLAWTYDALESGNIVDILERLRRPECYGAAITMPHKVAIIEHLDELTQQGRDIGACNTVFCDERDGHRRLVGTNTDVVGVREAFLRNVDSPALVYHNRPALVIGGGGAARSAIYALSKWLMCSQVYIVNRDDAEVQAVIQSCQYYAPKVTHLRNKQDAEASVAAGAVVGCIPDHDPCTLREREVRAIIEIVLSKPAKGVMLEMAYHPHRWTALATLAHRVGWQVILGTEAMIWQGLEQARLWTQKDLADLSVKKVKDVIARDISEELVSIASP